MKRPTAASQDNKRDLKQIGHGTVERLSFFIVDVAQKS